MWQESEKLRFGAGERDAKQGTQAGGPAGAPGRKIAIMCVWLLGNSGDLLSLRLATRSASNYTAHNNTG